MISDYLTLLAVSIAFQAMKFSAQRISDDGCRLTNMGAYVPVGESK